MASSEGILSIGSPERKGAFLELCKNLGNRYVTEFNYRYSHNEQAAIFMSVQLTGGRSELDVIIGDLQRKGYTVSNMSDNLLAKNHVRYMVGGHAPTASLKERLFSFEFPEHPGALLKFLETLGTEYNVTLFHYRNHGAEYGRVLCGIEVDDGMYDQVVERLNRLGYVWFDETDNECYRIFLKPQS